MKRRRCRTAHFFNSRALTNGTYGQDEENQADDAGAELGIGGQGTGEGDATGGLDELGYGHAEGGRAEQAEQGGDVHGVLVARGVVAMAAQRRNGRPMAAGINAVALRNRRAG